MTSPDSPHAPTLAVIGGGQLARMMAAAGHRARASRCACSPRPRASPRPRSSPTSSVGDYRDLATLRRVTAGCAVVTFDHEHVPTEHLHALDGRRRSPCGPGRRRWCTPRTRR